MKRRDIIIISALVVAGVTAAAGFGYVFNRTISHTGEQAIAVMNIRERQYLETLLQVKVGMTYEEVVDILGEPDRETFGLRPTWRVYGNPLSQVAVYFEGGRVRKIRWMKLGYFVYEIDHQTPE